MSSQRKRFFELGGVLTVVSFIGITGSAMAWDMGFMSTDVMRPYIGVDAVRINPDYENVSGPGFTVSGNDILDDELDGVSPYVGLQLNKCVAVEVGYMETKKAKKENVLGSTIDTKVKMSGVSADLVGTLPLTNDERLGLLGAVGYGHYKAKVNLSNGASSSNDDDAARVGLGLQYQMGEGLGVRGMARYINAEFDNSTDHLMQYTVGLNYKF